MTDTICALASGPGRAGVAVVRVSGPQAGPALAALAGRAPPPRRATLASLRDARDAAIDQALVLWFPAPRSFTGEDVAELHVHGGPAVVAAVLETLLAMPGLRLARAGEFTRRAYENGKLDLTQAEALADLVDAETEGQRRQALAQMDGALSAAVTAWRADLVGALALLEAAIDFPDEDLPADLAERVAPRLAGLRARFEARLAEGSRGERVREGYRVAILGAPNAGKSSLLNALAGREAAIVSDIPGTTRDVVEVRLALAGFAVWIADTAGLREAEDAIEAEGVRRALARAEDADLRVGVVEAQAGALDAPLAAALRLGDFLVRSKIDISPPSSLGDGPPGLGPLTVLAVSTRTGAGLDGLLAAIEGRVAADLGAREAAPLTRARHRAAVGAAAAALARAEQALARGPELAAEDLRLAARALDALIGRVDVEEILGEIFSSFCIGK